MSEALPGMNGGMERTLGEHGARLDNIESDVHEMKEDVRAIRDIVVQAKGGWKVMVLMIGCSTAIGAFLGWAASLLK